MQEALDRVAALLPLRRVHHRKLLVGRHHDHRRPFDLGRHGGGAGLTQRRNDCLGTGVKVTERPGLELKMKLLLAAGAAARA